MADNKAPPPNYDPLNPEVIKAELEFENEDIVARVKAILETADDWDKIEKIEDADDANDLTDFLDQMSKIWDIADGRRDKRKRAFDACAKVVQTYFKKIALDVLPERRNPLKAKLKVWLDAVNAEKAVIANQMMVAATNLEKGAQSPAEVKAAAKAMKEAKAFAKKAGIKTDFGSTVHVTSSWGFTVDDITKVPTKYLVVDQAAVMAHIRTGTPEEPVTIEGITVTRTSSLVG